MTPKPYRIERGPGAAQAAYPGGACPGDAYSGDACFEDSRPAADGARLDQILAAIHDLRRATEASAGETVEACRREMRELFALRGELDLMKDAITRTKREIALLHRSELSGRGMRRAADELDAVVESTERATTTLLSTVEEIEASAIRLRAGAELPEAARAEVESILSRAVLAYEACNFQDLTGQRIGKIVGVMKFVEDHLDGVISAWSALDTFRDLLEQTAAEEPPADDERALLNGPRLADDSGHVEQAEIDALFD